MKERTALSLVQSYDYMTITSSHVPSTERHGTCQQNGSVELKQGVTKFIFKQKNYRITKYI